MPDQPLLRIAWFSTGRGAGSYAALSRTIAAFESGTLPVQIAVLFCNREDGETEPTDRFLAHARDHKVRVETLSSVAFRKAAGGERSQPDQPLPEWRADYDAEVARRLAPYGFDLAVLFGYMLITTPVLYERWTLLNEHPALPWGPAGTWQQVIHRLIDEQATESGVMVHHATGELDRGPVFSYCRYRLGGRELQSLRDAPDPQNEDGPLFQSIRREGLAREVPLLHETLRLIASDGLPDEPIDLTQSVEAALKNQDSGLSTQD
jgi:folate-dependent phosphoribosylglycinamide formyltransferase PurN